MKALWVKMRRKLIGRWADRNSRFVWTTTAVNDAYGPADNVRNYLERRTIRTILAELSRRRPLKRACEIGCGYGRVIMVLKEFAEYVKGFEREPHLVDIARSLLCEIEFECVDSLTNIEDKTSYDLVMMSAVLQHLTDATASEVCAFAKRLTPRGYILCIEKTESINITENTEDGSQFLSRARSIGEYGRLMHPYTLLEARPRVVEPTYANPRPGTCMVFVSPLAGSAG
jgi:protein-L-isoaspartate O-methyltransferase